MNIIVKDIVKECCSRNCTPQRAEILSMVTKHHFYHDGLSSEGILIRIFERLAALPKEVSTK